MAEQHQFDERDPHHCAMKMKGMLQTVVEHAREDLAKLEDPHREALFETTADVLTGLITAYEHFERSAEPPSGALGPGLPAVADLTEYGRNAANGYLRLLRGAFGLLTRPGRPQRQRD
jgi:hypothetical protein